MSLYRNCRTAQVQIRGFSTSSSLRVGPESPNYIDVPRTLQPDLPQKPQVRGTLPVPREIFPARRPDKPTWAYISSATPEPTKEKTIKKNNLHVDAIEWKRRMAHSRRNNLREGLQELYKRKQATDDFIGRRSAEKQARRERILKQPQREDERLTSSSIIQAMKPTGKSTLPDPDREERLARSQLHVKAKAIGKSAERIDSLHTLYMNARSFITTEAQLAAEIDKVFPEGQNPAWGADDGFGENVWKLGVPPTVQSTVEGESKEAQRFEAVQTRLKKLAEEITGGKM